MSKLVKVKRADVLAFIGAENKRMRSDLNTLKKSPHNADLLARHMHQIRVYEGLVDVIIGQREPNEYESIWLSYAVGRCYYEGVIGWGEISDGCRKKLDHIRNIRDGKIARYKARRMGTE